MRMTPTGSPTAGSICRRFLMKPSSLSSRATSSLSFELGTSRRSCFDKWAFRIRVSRSEMGSVMLISVSLLAARRCFQARRALLPACLDHSGKVSLQRQVPEMDAAEPELAVVAARAAADSTPVPVPHLELGLPEVLGDLCGGGHGGSLLAS